MTRHQASQPWLPLATDAGLFTRKHTGGACHGHSEGLRQIPYARQHELAGIRLDKKLYHYIQQWKQRIQVDVIWRGANRLRKITLLSYLRGKGNFSVCAEASSEGLTARRHCSVISQPFLSLWCKKLLYVSLQNWTLVFARTGAGMEVFKVSDVSSGTWDGKWMSTPHVSGCKFKLQTTFRWESIHSFSDKYEQLKNVFIFIYFILFF